MPKWTALILTCPNRNSSLVFQKELKLRQEKGLIDKETLVISIEDPERPIGSGGATLNAIQVVAEALSARKKYRITQIEVLKNEFILIMHMGRSYPFDLIGKAFCTLPFQDKFSANLMTNFDLLYNLMTENVVGLNKEREHSDPGVYICSTDMIFLMPKNETIVIKNTPICVLSSLANREIVEKHGIFCLNDKMDQVENIHYKPDDEVLSKTRSTNGLFNLVSGIVYLSYEVTKMFYSLILYPPIDSCSCMGIDSGASPLCLSLFFDILLAGCKSIHKDTYLEGAFKSNHSVANNQKEILRQARLTLWTNLQSSHFQIKNITVSQNVKHFYMENESFEHRQNIFYNEFHDYLQNEQNRNLFQEFEQSENGELSLNSLNLSTKLSLKPSSKVISINSILENSNLLCNQHTIILHSQFKRCKINIGHNSYISDIFWEDKILQIPESLFVQNVKVNLECVNKEVGLNLVFGIEDNLSSKFNSLNWTIMNQTWSKFSSLSQITESDLWPNDSDKNERCLLNAKLYPLLHPTLSKEDMEYLKEFFLIDFANNLESPRMNWIQKWRQSLRLSIEDLLQSANLSYMFTNRRKMFNQINTKKLVKNVVENKVTQFNALIKNVVLDGYGDELLKNFDEAALSNSHDFIILPRIMAFMSNTLCEMASDLSSLRSGPSLNLNWSNAYDLIENGEVEKAIYSLAKERKNWMNRDDLIIRASRHYEGAMLSFIRQATGSFNVGQFKSSKIKLEPLEEKCRIGEDEWIEVSSPARLDLAGAWSDTPPITYECQGGSCVTNVAILVDGKKPIGSKGRIIKHSTNNNGDENTFFVKIVFVDSVKNDQSQVSLIFNKLSDFRDYNKPQAVACLMKAVLVFTKLVDPFDASLSLREQLKRKLNGSLELHTWTRLPQGSGLGTSSILIGCVLKVVWYLMGVNATNETLCYSTLLVEQLMTTNGGWQDQVGGLYSGFKFTTAKNLLPLEIHVKELNLNAEFLDLLNSRLILIYTGLTRLAKDLLLNVLRNWYAISSHIYDNVKELVKNGLRCADALEKGDLFEFGDCINNHRKQKLVMAPGSEPDTVKELINLIEPFVHGMALAGAGGGGFLYAFTKEPNCAGKIKCLIDEAKLSMKIYDAKISNDGIEYKIIKN